MMGSLGSFSRIWDVCGVLWYSWVCIGLVVRILGGIILRFGLLSCRCNSVAMNETWHYTQEVPGINYLHTLMPPPNTSTPAPHHTTAQYPSPNPPACFPPHNPSTPPHQPHT